MLGQIGQRIRATTSERTFWRCIGAMRKKVLNFCFINIKIFSASPERQRKYVLASTHIKIDPDFAMLKKRYLNVINRNTKWKELGEINELCASIQVNFKQKKIKSKL